MVSPGFIGGNHMKNKPECQDFVGALTQHAKYDYNVLWTLNCTIHGREIQLFCYMINSQIMENENCLLT